MRCSRCNAPIGDATDECRECGLSLTDDARRTTSVVATRTAHFRRIPVAVGISVAVAAIVATTAVLVTAGRPATKNSAAAPQTTRVVAPFETVFTASISPANATRAPHIEGDVVVTYDLDHLTARELATGRVVWDRPVDCPQPNGSQERSASLGSPVLVKCDGATTALEATTGRELWRRGFKVACVQETRGRGTIVCSNGSRMVVIDSGSGEERFTTDFEYANTTPNVFGDVIILEAIVRSTSTSATYQLRALDRDGRQLWERETTNDFGAFDTGIFDRGLLDIHELDPMTGADRWRYIVLHENERIDDADDDIVVLNNPDGWLTALGRAQGKTRWTKQLSSPARFAQSDRDQYALGDGVVVGISDTTNEDGGSGLHVVDAATGALLFEDPTVTAFEPVIGGGHLAYIEQKNDRAALVVRRLR